MEKYVLREQLLKSVFENVLFETAISKIYYLREKFFFLKNLNCIFENVFFEGIVSENAFSFEKF